MSKFTSLDFVAAGTSQKKGGRKAFESDLHTDLQHGGVLSPTIVPTSKTERSCSKAAFPELGVLEAMRNGGQELDGAHLKACGADRRRMPPCHTCIE